MKHKGLEMFFSFCINSHRLTSCCGSGSVEQRASFLFHWHTDIDAHTKEGRKKERQQSKELGLCAKKSHRKRNSQWIDDNAYSWARRTNPSRAREGAQRDSSGTPAGLRLQPSRSFFCLTSFCLIVWGLQPITLQLDTGDPNHFRLQRSIREQSKTWRVNKTLVELTWTKGKHDNNNNNNNKKQKHSSTFCRGLTLEL